MSNEISESTFIISAGLGQGRTLSDQDLACYLQGEFGHWGIGKKVHVWLLLKTPAWRPEVRRWKEAVRHVEQELESAKLGTSGSLGSHMDREGYSVLSAERVRSLRPVPGIGGSSAPRASMQFALNCRRLSLALGVGRSSGVSLQIDRSSISIVESSRPTLRWTGSGSVIQRIAVLERASGMEVQTIDRPSGSSWTIEADLKSSTLYCWRFWLQLGGKTEEVEYVFTTPSLEALEFAAGQGQPKNDLEHGVFLVELNKHSEALPLLEGMLLELSGEELEAAQDLIAAVRLHLSGD